VRRSLAIAYETVAQIVMILTIAEFAQVIQGFVYRDVSRLRDMENTVKNNVAIFATMEGVIGKRDGARKDVKLIILGCFATIHVLIHASQTKVHAYVMVKMGIVFMDVKTGFMAIDVKTDAAVNVKTRLVTRLQRNV
jgi:hypothetical protein